MEDEESTTVSGQQMPSAIYEPEDLERMEDMNSWVDSHYRQPPDGEDMGREGSTGPLDDPDERKVVHSVLNSFFRYRDQEHLTFTHRRRQSFYAMPQRHWSLLSNPPFNILQTMNRIDDAIDKNADIAEAILRTGLEFTGMDPLPSLGGEAEASFVTKANLSRSKPLWQGPLSGLDQEKAHSTIRQIYRDWSAEGKAERDACYVPVLQALDEEFINVPFAEKENISVLVPGAGLGRSVVEVGCRGYTVQGNEISYHMIMASDMLINHTTHAGQYELYPWAHDCSNHLTREDQLQCVKVPDVHPGTVMTIAGVGLHNDPRQRLSFSSADFCLEYSKELYTSTFDAVASIFFIDTAPNIIRYVETVYNCLREGGIWINLGPLKWHFENDPPGKRSKDKESRGRRSLPTDEPDDLGVAEPGSVELTHEEVISLVEHFGFRVERNEVRSLETGYISNPRGMWKGSYRPSFWIARKLPFA